MDRVLKFLMDCAMAVFKFLMDCAMAVLKFLGLPTSLQGPLSLFLVFILLVALVFVFHLLVKTLR